MTILLESSSTAAPGGGATTLVINAPTGIQAGDVLVATIIGSVVSGSLAVTADGWVVREEILASNAVLTVLTRVAGGSEPGSYTFDYSVSASTRRGGIDRMSGVDNSDPLAATPTTNSGTTGTTVTGLSITTAVDDAYVILAAGWGANSTSFTPSDLDTHYNVNRVGVAGRIQATAGASGNKTATITSGHWRTILWALRPATEAPNQPPTVALNTADESELSTLPTLEFTGTDADDDDITYQIQIGDNPDFSSGSRLTDNFPTGGGGLNIHPDPFASGDTWLGDPMVDDRPGQSFTASGGVLDKIEVQIGNGGSEPNGTARIRVYEHAGTYGTSSAPANAASAANTPTPDWLAVSDDVIITEMPAGPWTEFVFSGTNRIHLDAGKHYIWIFDWIPNDRASTNRLALRGDATSSGALHAGNNYIDGNNAPNLGPHSDWDVYFRLYEVGILLDKVSGTDNGFENTVTPADTDPFNSGEKISFTVQAADELEPALYYWRVRGKDPAGTDSFGDWSATRSFTATADTSETKTVNDTGSGSDAVGQISVGVGVSESGTGQDGLPGTQASTTLSDSGAGVDLVSQILAAAGIAESGSGAETISLSALATVLESGAGADAIGQLLASLAVGESGSGADLIDVITEIIKSVSDSGAGLDAIAQVLAAVTISESGSGADLVGQILANLSVAETGSGADLVDVIGEIIKSVSESGAGADGVAIQATLEVVETGTGAEALALYVTLSVAESGAGADLVSVITEAIKTVMESGAGLDGVSVAVAPLTIGEAGVGQDNLVVGVQLTILDVGAGVDAISVLATALKIVAESGQGLDAVGQIGVNLAVPESGQGVDALSQILAALMVADLGAGVDMAVGFDAAVRLVKVTFTLSRRQIVFSLAQRVLDFSLATRQIDFVLEAA